MIFLREKFYKIVVNDYYLATTAICFVSYSRDVTLPKIGPSLKLLNEFCGSYSEGDFGGRVWPTVTSQSEMCVA